MRLPRSPGTSASARRSARHPAGLPPTPPPRRAAGGPADAECSGFDFPGASHAVGDWPASVTAADVDGNGAVDLVTANAKSDTVSVLRNLGDGTFAAQVTYAVGIGPYRVTAADVNGDGVVDLVTANYFSDTVSVLRSLGDGTFAAQVTYAVGIGPYSVTAADVDGDGAVDLVTANANSDTVSVLRNLGDGTFEAQVTYAVGNAPLSVTAADFDGDGAVDLVTANAFSDTVSVLRNQGDGTFAAQVTLRGGERSSQRDGGGFRWGRGGRPSHGELRLPYRLLRHRFGPAEPRRRHVCGPGDLHGGARFYRCHGGGCQLRRGGRPSRGELLPPTTFRCCGTWATAHLPRK